MLVCISIDMLMMTCFIIMGAMFLKSKGKGCNYIAGYNSAAISYHMIHTRNKIFDENFKIR